MRRTYRGRSVEVTFDLAQCTHIGECIRRLPEVFALDRRPWISPDAVTADELASVIERCPSGALQFHRLDGGKEEQGPPTPRVTAIRNGPLLVRGRIDVRREDGSVETMPRAALCRCGQSANKPFCDNTHLRVGFKAPGELIKIEMSPVRITPDHPIDRATDPRAVS
jgi:uncharacterized Fe-S cluster protein YjdI/CDGSH-type Zn-finger protein